MVPPIAGEAREARELLIARHADRAADGARLVTLLDAEYPEVLAGSTQPPPVLAIKGSLPPGPAVALVGSRLADAYGRQVAAHFARCLAAAGVAVVSGMAHGIDEAAHQGALSIPHGRTVAVLGCGLGVDYPRGHAPLAAAIAARGALVSEFPRDAPPRPWHFPVRNRTIACLAAVTVVVQATPRSGSLDTARHALQLGRPVFAVPGPVFAPLSWGPHALLSGGARLATQPEDLLAALPGGPGWTTSKPQATPRGDPPAGGRTRHATPVLAALSARTSRSADQVMARTGLDAGTVLATLLELEVAGEIERRHGWVWRLAKRRHPSDPSGCRAAPALGVAT